MRWNAKLLVSLFVLSNLLVSSFSYELIVKYKDSSTMQTRSISSLKAKNASVSNVRSFKYAPNQYKIIEVDEANAENVLAELNNDADIEYAHPNYQAKLLIAPNDSYYVSDSYYRGLFDGYGAQVAWDVTTGSSQIIVAILDTGIDTDHPDLVGRCLTQDWKDYGNNDNNPEDYNGHGTHVAGIIGANSNNGIGATGLNWNCKLLPIKVFTDAGTGTSVQAIDGIYYAVSKGAKVINMSFGFYDSSNNPLFFEGAMQDAINYAYSNGVCMVVAAGNEDLNISTYKLTPACNDGGSNKIIGVSSLTSTKAKSNFSNYSSQYVDISAFGSIIYSTYTGNSYTVLSGTSMAAPAVSGIISLLLSLDPTLTPSQVMGYLKSSAENIDAYNSSYTGQLGAGLVRADNLLSLFQGSKSSTQNTEQIIQYYNYPNPVESAILNSNSTTFFAEFTKPVSNANISIYSITGRKVYDNNVSQSASTLMYHVWDLSSSGSSLPPGPYIAVIKATVGGSFVTKYHKVLIK